MAGLLYYVPGRQTASIDQVAELGLGYAFEREVTPRGCQRGPDGGPGIVIADGRRVTDLGYYPARQVWQQILGNPAGVWVGTFTDGPTLPADLAREEQLRGHEVRLADGQPWLVPVARGLSEEDGELRWYYAVPRRMALGEDGVWRAGDVVGRYRGLWEIAERWWDAIQGEGPAREEFAAGGRKIAAAIEVLQQNYRLAAAEVSLLGLFDEETAEKILMALVDWPTLEAYLQKKTGERIDGVSPPPQT